MIGSPANKLSAEHVVWAYRLLLDREPESAEMIEHHLAASDSAKSLRDGILASEEFRSQSALHRHGSDQTSLGALTLRRFTDVDLWVYENDVIYAGTPDGQPYEPNVHALFREAVRPGDVVMDVGANMGYFTVLAGHLTGADGRVFAIEVRPENGLMVRKNVRHAGLDHVELWPIALWDSVGHHVIQKVRFNPDGIPTTNRHLGASTLDSDASALVPTAPLDCLAGGLERLDLLKLDIEGAELRAVLGARETLVRLRPRIILEFSPMYIADTSGDDG